MAVKIRMTRTGATNTPSFRIVAADCRSPRDGRHIEILGWYDPKRTGEKCVLKRDRIAYWERQGAEVSDTVKSLLKRQPKVQAAS
jgi:small subunit ribosomal protein S16